MERRGIVCGGAFCVDRNKIIEIANADRSTETMKTHAQLGDATKIVATPAGIGMPAPSVP